MKMNDENIKEILKKIKSVSNFDDYVDFVGTEFKPLLDYIINLQQIEQEHQKINGELRERIAYLERSNDRREDTILGLRQEINDMEDKNSKLEIALQNIQEDYDRRIKEIDVLKKKLNRRYYKNEYERLKQENERLKQELKDRPFMDYTTDVYEELEDYKSRCEKAIEYINTNYFIVGRIKDLLNILQNGSDKDD